MTEKIKQALEKIEVQRQSEIEKIKQLENRKKALSQKLKTEEAKAKKADETRLKILLGSWLKKLIKDNRESQNHRRAELINYLNFEKNDNARVRNIKIINDFFDDLR